MARDFFTVPENLLFHHQYLSYITDTFARENKEGTPAEVVVYRQGCYLSQNFFDKLVQEKKAKRNSENEYFWNADCDLNSLTFMDYGTEVINGIPYYRIDSLRIGPVFTRFLNSAQTKFFFVMDGEEAPLI